MSAAAVAAANWWAEAIGSPTFDNGDAMSSMLGSMVGSRAPVGDSAGFAEALVAKVDERLGVMAGWDGVDEPYLTLSVDYGPEQILAEAAQAAGVGLRRFPWKTSMWIYSDHVTVSAGYQAQTVLVWASDEWLSTRPDCTSQHYDEAKYATVETYHGEPWACSLPMFHAEAHAYDKPLALCAVCNAPEDFWHHPDRFNYGRKAEAHPFAACLPVQS